MLLDADYDLVEPEQLQEVQRCVHNSEDNGDLILVSGEAGGHQPVPVDQAIDRERVEEDAEHEEQRAECVHIQVIHRSLALAQHDEHRPIVHKGRRDLCDVGHHAQ